MKERVKQRLPKAREKGLIVQELTDEVVVYDLDRDKAHCLNQWAAAVWKLCDGHTTPAGIARLLEKTSTGPVSDEFVWLALEELGRGHLLEESLSGVRRISRREAVRRIGLGAAITLPIVVSITAPTAVEAATCVPRGGFCNTSAQCCTGFCNTVQHKCEG